MKKKGFYKNGIMLLAFIVSVQLLQGQEMPARENTGVQVSQATVERRNMYRQLNLTREQQQQLAATYKDSRAKLKAVREDTTLTQTHKRIKIAAIRKEQMEKRKTILTPEQYAKLEHNLKNTPGNERGTTNKTVINNSAKRGGKNIDENGLSKNNSGRPGNNLALTPDQKQQLKILRDDGVFKAKSIRENRSLSDEQKKQQLLDLRKDVDMQRRNILTADQYKIWKEKQRDWRINRPNRKNSNNINMSLNNNL